MIIVCVSMLKEARKSIHLQLCSFVSLPRMISSAIDQYHSVAICGRFVGALCVCVSVEECVREKKESGLASRLRAF